jgi:predicted transcriptional regulator
MQDRPNPTDAELDILRALWDHGPCTVRQVHEYLAGSPPRGYTTVLKLLQIMCDKGLVRRDERQRAHIYSAALSIGQVQGKLLNHLLDKAFDNSTSRLIMQALATRPASREELAQIRRLLDEAEGASR